MANATTEQVMQHHEAALLSGNLDELAKDYTEDSVLITPIETYKGPESIKAAFAAMMNMLTPEALANFKRSLSKTFRANMYISCGRRRRHSHSPGTRFMSVMGKS
jgi:lipoate-protein ligase A